MPLVGWNDPPKKGLALDPSSLGSHSAAQHPKICVYQAKKVNHLSLLLNQVFP